VGIAPWLAVNATYLFLRYGGCVNHELLMMPRNLCSVYVPSSKVLDHLKKDETVVVAKPPDEEAKAFPDF
jgi:hypothetical protein